jgi:hypothetical protein
VSRRDLSDLLLKCKLNSTEGIYVVHMATNTILVKRDDGHVVVSSVAPQVLKLRCHEVLYDVKVP